MAAQQNAVIAGGGSACCHIFGQDRPAAYFGVGTRVRVERDLFITVHEDIQFHGRVRALTRFLFSLFEKDAAISTNCQRTRRDDRAVTRRQGH